MMKKKLLLSSILLLCIAIGLYSQDYPDFHTAVGTLPNEGVLSIPKNTYRLDLAGKGTFRVTGKKNLHIDGNGSTIICNKQITAFNFINCENVTFSNFYIEYESPCSTQGTIKKFLNGSKTLEVEIHEGYPMVNPTIDQKGILIYDNETRELVKNYHTTYATSAIQVNNATRTVTLDIWSKDGIYKVGDYINFDNVSPDAGGHAIITEYSKNMKMDSITLYDSPSMSFVEHGCENSHYYRCEVNRKKNYPGRPQDRLSSSRKDGFHCKYDIVGPTIEECVVKYQGDDAVNISGYFFPVYKVNEARKRIYVLTTYSDYGQMSIKSNDNLLCVNNDGTIRGKDTVFDITGASTQPTQDERNACFQKLTTIRDKDNLIYGASIALNKWIQGINVGDMICSNDRLGNGFQLLNNDVGHNRSRGFLIKASNGKIQGNTITGCAMSAISVGPEFFWLEGGCSKKLDISNNIIKDCMFDESMTTSAQAGALTVACVAPNGTLAKVGAFDSISIHRNTITGCPKPCVFLNSIVSGYYYKNTVEPDENIIRYHGYNYLVSNQSAYYEKFVGNIIKDQDPLSGISIETDNSESNAIRINADGSVSSREIWSTGKTNLKVCDMLGKTVLTDMFEKTSSVSLKSLFKGVYIVILVNDNKSYTKKYFVQ
jgi:hypothetical protein